MPRKTDKRVRLIEAAAKLFHQQGFNLTTLADIAEAAGVPLGNVYYYFKTKEAILVAVIEKWSKEWTERLTAWTQVSDPLARLETLIHSGMEDLETTARYGCPIGGLCQELGKQGGFLADLAAKLLNDILSWTEEQFKLLGKADTAAGNALNLISSLQGMYLLTHTFKDPKLANRQARSLLTWVETVAGRKATAQPAILATVLEETA